MIKDLHNQLLGGETTAVALLEKHLKSVDPAVHSFISLTEDLARQQAQSVDERIKKGEKISLLAGLPCAIKDLINIEGTVTTAGSKMLENYISPYDATVIEKLRSEDAVFMAKANLDEFACGGSTEHSAYGVTRNPHDHDRVPGGSSGGSVSSVAAGEVIWSLGTDTGGSIRQPSSFCGVVGLKPTYGRVSRYGVIAYGSSLDQVGPIASSVEDVAIILSAIAGRDERDATSAHSDGQKYEDHLGESLKGKKIGIAQEFLADGIDERVKEKFLASVEQFKSLGAEIVDVSLAQTKNALATYYVIAPAELSSNLARFDGIRFGHHDKNGQYNSIEDYYKHVRGEGFGEEIKRRLMLGTYTLSAGYYDAYYKKAGKVRSLIKKEFSDVFENVDFIYTPTTPEPAFKIGERIDDPLKMYLTDIYNVPVNLAGLPAISIPIGTIDEGGKSLPIGGQIIGKWFDEEGILNAGYMYEQSV